MFIGQILIITDPKKYSGGVSNLKKIQDPETYKIR